MSLDLDQLSTCTRCDLAATRHQVVVGSGSLRAKLFVVGEAPGAREDEGGQPFVGRSGQLLFRLLDDELGLSRDDCFVTNAVKCRPPGNRVPTRRELATCRPWLDTQFALAAPRAVLALGATAARATFGLREPMGVVHGRVSLVGVLAGVATYHPAAALRGGGRIEATIRADLAVLATLLEGP